MSKKDFISTYELMTNRVLCEMLESQYFRLCGYNVTTFIKFTPNYEKNGFDIEYE
jgi:hypothetical protein